jgi:hypothetical protein
MKRRAVAPVLVTLIVLVLALALGGSLLPQRSGSLVPVVYATKTQLTKRPGETVNFKVKAMNTGTEATVYIVVAKYAEHGSDAWETAAEVDAMLEPGAYIHLELGGLEVTDEMAGKYYDALFLLLDAESEEILDQATLEDAWYVEEPIVAGSIIDKWVY